MNCLNPDPYFAAIFLVSMIGGIAIGWVLRA